MSDFEDNFSDNENSDNSEEEDEYVVKKKKLNINNKNNPVISKTIDNYNEEDNEEDEEDVDDIDEEEEDDDEADDEDDVYDSDNEYEYANANYNSKSQKGGDVNVDNDDTDNLINIKPTNNLNEDDEDDNDDDDDKDENYLQKFDNEITKNYINDFHPECYHHNYDEIIALTKIIKNENNIIIDSFHRTIPYLTKYEKTKILGQRAKQIEYGSLPFIKVPENIIEPHIIAELELQEKKIPFIIRRPLPNGSFEYWNLKDLEILTY